MNRENIWSCFEGIRVLATQRLCAMKKNHGSGKELAQALLKAVAKVKLRFLTDCDTAVIKNG